MSEDDDGRVHIPVAFWRSMSEQEFRDFAACHGVLNAEQCARLWRLTDRQGEPPQSMELEFSVDDILRLWPPTTRRQQRLVTALRRKARS